MKRRLLAPLIIMMMLGGVASAYALTWTAPTYPFYGAGGGAMYFYQGMTATNGSWIGGILCFTDFNYALAGAFNDTVGFDAQNGTTMILLEAIPTDHILIQTNGFDTYRNVTLYLPGNNVVNVTNAAAWTWNNATSLLNVTTPMGIANINISFILGGTTPTIFYIPQWFLNQGGAYFGVTNFFAQLLSVMAAFVAWFTSAISNIITLIYWIMTGVVFIASQVITWFGRIIAFFVNLLTIIGSFFDGTYTSGLPNLWTIFNVSQWIDFVPIIGFILWFDSLYRRKRKTGQGVIEIFIGDAQKVMYVVEQVWNWSWIVFNFVVNTVMTFVSLLWGLIP